MRSQHRVTVPLGGSVSAADLEKWLKDIPPFAQVSASHSSGDRIGEPPTYSLTAAWSVTEGGQPAAPITERRVDSYQGPDYSRGPDGGIRETSR